MGLRRVAVTGLSIATSLGLDAETTWSGLIEGRSQPSWVRLGDSQLPAMALPPLKSSPGNADPVLDLLDRLADQLINHAQLDPRDLRMIGPGRVGCLVGLSKGGVKGLASKHQRLLDGQWDVGDGIASFGCWPHAGVGQVQRRLNLPGPGLAPVAACATGLVAAIRGAQWIQERRCDAAIVGSADLSATPWLLASFRKMNALARIDYQGDPARAMLPWDRQRSGFLVGEGGALLMLEAWELARARGAPILAEWLAGVEGSDAYHLTDLDPNPTGLASLMTQLLQQASGPGSVSPEQIDLVNLHATATRSNDPLECQALRQAFGRAAESLICVGHKPQIGHLLGASGSVELALTVLALDRRCASVTLTGTDPDPLCDLDLTREGTRHQSIRFAIKLSLGFGGHLALALLGHPQEVRS